MKDKIRETADFLRDAGFVAAEYGVILGTGLAHFLQRLTIIQTIDYADIPNFPVATVEFHHGKLVFGQIEGKNIVVMQGRFHFYEGYTMQEVTFPVRVMKLLGVKHLLLSNAAGGINNNFKKGDLVVISDHINLQTSNPLIGKNLDDSGPRFPDMSQPYNAKMIIDLERLALQHKLSVRQGVYVAVNGPNLETRAEYRFLKIIGADLVGMSTVPEVIVANHMSIDCLAVSVITDECDPDNLKPVDIPEIIAIAAKADEKLSLLFSEFIKLKVA